MAQAAFGKVLGLLALLGPAPADAGADCVIRLKFGHENAALTGAAQAMLHDLALNHRLARMQILGNADMVANEPGNQALAVARANSVFAYLVASGLPEQQITIARAPPDLLVQAGIAPLESRRFVLVRIGKCDQTSAPPGALIVVTTTTTTVIRGAP